ncbi:MAG: CHAP domain-containing protein [Kangiellaceae bacterium]|nr:CHAP domain-containing protein [Kangiellaceae bacterium]
MPESREVLRRLVPDSDVLYLQGQLHKHGYFREKKPCEGLFCGDTEVEVKLFQSQHIGKDGFPLVADGVVGGKTWWALDNPSGDAQRNGVEAKIPEGLSAVRQTLLEILFEEHAKDVYEIPDGSNSSLEIDKYWGDTGLKAYPWCCAFVSWSLDEVLGRFPIGNKHHVGVMNMWRNARQLGMGTAEPKPGDIFIQDLGRGKGHTGFVISVSSDNESIYTCEGNSGNRLKLGKRNMASINHYIDAFQDGQSLDFERLDFSASDLSGNTTR